MCGCWGIEEKSSRSRQHQLSELVCHIYAEKRSRSNNHSNISAHRQGAKSRCACTGAFLDFCHERSVRSLKFEMNITARLLVAVAPFLLTFLFAWLVSGPLSLGGGEKDILLAIPLLLWSLLFLCCYLVLWWRRFTLSHSITVAAGFATALIVVAWLVLIIALQVLS